MGKGEVMGKKRKLTDKQKRFVAEYAIDCNATQAAIRAGFSKKNAGKIGPELLGKTCVLEAAAKKQQSIAEKCGITAEKVLREYALLAFSDMGEMAKWDANGVSLNSSKDLGEKTKAVMEVSESISGKSEISTVKKKMHDKKGALDALAKHLKLWYDKVLVRKGYCDVSIHEIYFNILPERRDTSIRIDNLPHRQL